MVALQQYAKVRERPVAVFFGNTKRKKSLT
jgi:hypothetical protein